MVPSGSNSSHLTETAESWREVQRNLPTGLDRLIERGDQFQALATLQPVDESGRLVFQTINHMIVIGFMPKPVDIRRVDGEPLDDLPVRRKFVDKTPMPDLVDGEARDLDGALLPQNRERAFEIRWPCGGCGLDNAQSAVAEFQGRNRRIFGFDLDERGRCARVHALDFAEK